jgi:hypothetical protein
MTRKPELALGREPTFDYMKGANIDLMDGPGKDRMRNGDYFKSFRRNGKTGSKKVKVAPLPNQPAGTHVEYMSKALLQEAQLRAIDPAVLSSVISAHLGEATLTDSAVTKKKLNVVLGGLLCKEITVDRAKFPVIASLNQQSPYQLARIDNNFFRASSYLIPELADGKLKAIHCVVAIGKSRYADRDATCAVVLENAIADSLFVSHDGIFFNVTSTTDIKQAVELLDSTNINQIRVVVDKHSDYYKTVASRLESVLRSLSNIHHLRRSVLATIPAAQALLPTGKRMTPVDGSKTEQREEDITQKLEKQRTQRERQTNERKRQLEQEAVRQKALKEKRLKEVKRQASIRLKQRDQQDRDHK